MSSTKIKIISIKTWNSIYYTELCVVDRYGFNFYRQVFFWKILPLQNSKWCHLSLISQIWKHFIYSHSVFYFLFFDKRLQCSVTSFWADSHNMWFKYTNISETKPISITRIEVHCNTPDDEEDTVSFWNTGMLEPPEMSVSLEFYQILLLWKLHNM